MARSFLATLRGADARSLARALALLLVFGGLLEALHSGTMAGATRPATVLCTAGGVSVGDAGTPSSPLPREHDACFTLGCGPLFAGALAAADNAPSIALPMRGAHVLAHASSIDARPKPGNNRPRGPPVLA
jgi:hypothetical protein